MEKFKSIAEIDSPDERIEHFGSHDLVTGGFSPLTIEEHHSRIKNIRLKGIAPEKIQNHFTTAKNILLYSWYVYRFVMVGKLHAYSCVEFSLRDILGKEKITFKAELRNAVEKGWIQADSFKSFSDILISKKARSKIDLELGVATEGVDESLEAKQYVDALVNSIPFLRNELAHGSSMLFPHGYAILETCGELIDQLYENSSS